MSGHGRQVGPARPDWGDGWADLECDECGATWTGPVGEHCSYCIVHAEKVLRWADEDRKRWQRRRREVAA